MPSRQPRTRTTSLVTQQVAFDHHQISAGRRRGACSTSSNISRWPLTTSAPRARGATLGPATSAGTHRLYTAQPSGSASRRTAGITAWPAPSRSPGRTPRPSRRAGRPGCASAAAAPRTAGGAPPARHPPRRPQSRRSPDTSTATVAARRPRSASGSQSTAQDASPDARDASSEDEPRSDAGRSRYRPLPSDPPPTERCARAIRLQHSTLPASPTFRFSAMLTGRPQAGHFHSAPVDTVHGPATAVRLAKPKASRVPVGHHFPRVFPAQPCTVTRAGLPARVPGGRSGQRQGHRTQPLRGGGWRACGFRPKSDGLTAGTTRDQRAER